MNLNPLIEPFLKHTNELTAETFMNSISILRFDCVLNAQWFNTDTAKRDSSDQHQHRGESRRNEKHVVILIEK